MIDSAAIELGVLARGRREHLAQPLLRNLATGLGDGVDGAVGVARAAHRLVHFDEAEPRQSLERLIQAGAGAHVDDPVLALLLEELLHAVDVHRLGDEPQGDIRPTAIGVPCSCGRSNGSWTGTY
jgi:hypothetical protein